MAATDGGTTRLLRHSDIADALLLSDEARWNQTAEDWAVFIDHGECFGEHVDRGLVASAAVLPFGGGFGWISMVLVTAGRRRQGVASRLMNRCIEAMRRSGDAAMLDATPEGATVYRQLGFRRCCAMARWRGMGNAEPAGRGDPRPEKAAAFPQRAEMLARDRQAFGGDRGFLLETFMNRSGTRLFRSGGGFAICREGRRATQIGPLVAGSEGQARDLLEEALAAASGPVILDVLDAGAVLDPVLVKHGFAAFRTFERMALDRDALPGEPQAVMVAAGPEFG